MNRKKLFTVLFALFFSAGLSVSEQAFAVPGEYDTEYSERIVRTDDANIAQDANPNLKDIQYMDDGGDEGSVFYESEDEDDDTKIDEDDVTMYEL